ncbi:MAG: 50S ribosomal protein L10 [Bacillota bacterium]|nr:50S ribosomal protein L10 [Bacillota bacterium]
MAKKEEKAITIADLRSKLSRAQSMVLADYRGLTVAQMTDLRRKAREIGVELRVVKNTLASRAASEIGAGDLDVHLKGPTAIAFGYADPVAPARLLVDFIRTARVVELKGGYAEGRVLSPQDVRALATLPSREVLLSQVLAAMMGPLSNMASVLVAPLRGIAAVTDGLRKQRESAAD